MTPLSFVLAVLAITQPAMAHFQLMSPAPRIYDDLLELDAPCGGSNTTTVRHPFPISKLPNFCCNGQYSRSVCLLNPSLVTLYSILRDFILCSNWSRVLIKDMLVHLAYPTFPTYQSTKVYPYQPLWRRHCQSFYHMNNLQNLFIDNTNPLHLMI